MRVWLITTGEPLPIDNNNPRLMRTGIFANLLADNGHEVIWWSTTFNHTTKEFRYTENTTIELGKQLQLKLLHSKGYKHNISLDRVIDHRQVAANFRKVSPKEEKPHIIIASFPTLDLAKAAVDFGQKHKIPVLIDVRDLWPEVFIDIAPNILKPLVKTLLFPLFMKNKYIFNRSSGVVGLTKAFVDISLNKIGRAKAPFDAVFPLAYQKIHLTTNAQVSEAKKWKERKIDLNSFIICFFGSIGHHSDLETVIEAAKILERKGKKFEFVFCGIGDSLEKYKTQALCLKNFHFPGFVGRTEIISMMKMAKVGIIPYKSTINYQNNITNKAIEYLSEGLPIITGLTGYFRNFILDNNCGVCYENRNANSLVELLENLSTDPSKLQSISKNALNLFETKFKAEKVYHQYMNHLENVVENYNKHEAK